MSHSLLMLARLQHKVFSILDNFQFLKIFKCKGAIIDNVDSKIKTLKFRINILKNLANTIKCLSVASKGIRNIFDVFQEL